MVKLWLIEVVSEAAEARVPIVVLEIEVSSVLLDTEDDDTLV